MIEELKKQVDSLEQWKNRIEDTPLSFPLDILSQKIVNRDIPVPNGNSLVPAGLGTFDTAIGVMAKNKKYYIEATNADVTPPTRPTNVVATATSSTAAHITWSASYDAVGVTVYTIYRGGVFLSTTASTFYDDGSLSPATTYEYYVFASDAAGNDSLISDSAFVTTNP